MNSMTGFGEATLNTDIGGINIEIRSENHRFLDLKIQLNESLSSLETVVSELISQHIKRGKIRVKISLIEDVNNNSILNKNFKETYKILKRIKRDLNLNDEIKLEHILKMDDINSSAYQHKLPKSTNKLIVSGIKKALVKFNRNRKIEGNKLSKDILSRVRLIRELSKKIKRKRVTFSKEARDKIVQRVNEILGEIQVDENRLIQEVAFLKYRSDISEELVRLDAHITKFIETSKSDGPIGKELDFLIQEMNRECGTISAKCKNTEISHHTINLRSELEKIKEQIQNIE